MELLSLKTRLCQLLRCNERAISFAGIKDKKAITYQYGTVRNVSCDKLLQATAELPGVEVGNFKYREKELKIGELWGNQFIITLHGVDENPAILEKAVEDVKEKGYE